MNFTGGSQSHPPAIPHRRKPKNSHFAANSRSRNPGPTPTTPLSSWKFFDDNDEEQDDVVVHHHTKLVSELFRRARVQVSARKLAAGLWQMRFTEVSVGAHCNQLRPQPDVRHVGIKFPFHRKSKDYSPKIKDRLQLQTALPVFHPKNEILHKLESSLQYPKCSMEGATKWELRCSKVYDEIYRFYSHMKLLENRNNVSISIGSSLQAELIRARSRINELEAKVHSSKKNVQHLLRKVKEERISWQSREHAKIRAVADDLKGDLSREKKSCQRMEILNSKLVNQLANARLSFKQIMRNYEDEKRLRELMEKVCNELAKQIGEDEATVEGLKKEYKKVRKEVKEERNMLQMAEVWREERVQMKLGDAKLALEERYYQMNKLIKDLETFLSSRNSNLDVMELREAELIPQAIKSMNIQDIKEFSYVPSQSDDIFSVYEDLKEGEANEEEIEPCVNYMHTRHASKIQSLSPNNDVSNKKLVLKLSKHVINYNSGLEEDIKGGEIASLAEDQGSTCTLEGSDSSVNRVSQGQNVLESITECEENTNQESLSTEISQVYSLSDKQTKQKASHVSNPWKSHPSNSEFNKTMLGENNLRLPNVTVSSVKKAFPCKGSAEGEFICQDIVAQRSATDSANPHITRGMKGCIEWPRGIPKHNMKAKLLEVRIESQKSQLRHILK
ncbi:hypothetical protein FCV25MIE_32134 [Fagus crenata]